MSGEESRQLDQLVSDFEAAWAKYMNPKGYPQVTFQNVEQCRAAVVKFLQEHP